MENVHSSDTPDNDLYSNFISAGDEEAFRVLFDRYRSPLILFIDEIIHNRDDAEELMMDCFAVIISLKTRYTGRNGASFKTWLYTLAKNRAYSFLRKLKNKPLMSEYSGYEEPEDTTPEEHTIRKERDIKLKAALDTLPQDYRTALYLLYYENMKPEEIARIMNKSIKQIYNLTSRGKDRLKESLKEDEYTWDI